MTVEQFEDDDQAQMYEMTKLREALAFYAEPKNYVLMYIPSRNFHVSETICDNGRKARAALGLPIEVTDQ